MRRDEAIAMAAEARVGRIATVRPDGTPHVVPVVFALVRSGEGLRLFWAVDAKPKRSSRLRRIENLRSNPVVEVAIDGYDEDWDRLWWVRLRGRGRVVGAAEERREALEALAGKYPQYRERAPEGDVVAVDVDHVASWRASEPQ